MAMDAVLDSIKFMILFFHDIQIAQTKIQERRLIFTKLFLRVSEYPQLSVTHDVNYVPFSTRFTRNLTFYI